MTWPDWGWGGGVPPVPHPRYCSWIMDRSHTSSYLSSVVVTIAVSCTVFEIARHWLKSAIFLPCDAMYSADQLCRRIARCLSARLTVNLWLEQENG